MPAIPDPFPSEKNEKGTYVRNLKRYAQAGAGKIKQLSRTIADKGEQLLQDINEEDGRQHAVSVLIEEGCPDEAIRFLSQKPRDIKAFVEEFYATWRGKPSKQNFISTCQTHLLGSLSRKGHLSVALDFRKAVSDEGTRRKWLDVIFKNTLELLKNPTSISDSEQDPKVQAARLAAVALCEGQVDQAAQLFQAGASTQQFVQQLKDLKIAAENIDNYLGTIVSQLPKKGCFEQAIELKNQISNLEQAEELRIKVIIEETVRQGGKDAVLIAVEAAKAGCYARAVQLLERDKATLLAFAEALREAKLDINKPEILEEIRRQIPLYPSHSGFPDSPSAARDASVVSGEREAEETGARGIDRETANKFADKFLKSVDSETFPEEAHFIPVVFRLLQNRTFDLALELTRQCNGETLKTMLLHHVAYAVLEAICKKFLSPQDSVAIQLGVEAAGAGAYDLVENLIKRGVSSRRIVNALRDQNENFDRQLIQLIENAYLSPAFAGSLLPFIKDTKAAVIQLGLRVKEVQHGQGRLLVIMDNLIKRLKRTETDLTEIAVQWIRQGSSGDLQIIQMLLAAYPATDATGVVMACLDKGYLRKGFLDFGSQQNSFEAFVCGLLPQKKENTNQLAVALLLHGYIRDAAQLHRQRADISGLSGQASEKIDACFKNAISEDCLRMAADVIIQCNVNAEKIGSALLRSAQTDARSEMAMRLAVTTLLAAQLSYNPSKGNKRTSELLGYANRLCQEENLKGPDLHARLLAHHVQPGTLAAYAALAGHFQLAAGLLQDGEDRAVFLETWKSEDKGATEILTSLFLSWQITCFLQLLRMVVAAAFKELAQSCKSAAISTISALNSGLFKHTSEKRTTQCVGASPAIAA